MAQLDTLASNLDEAARTKSELVEKGNASRAQLDALRQKKAALDAGERLRAETSACLRVFFDELVAHARRRPCACTLARPCVTPTFVAAVARFL